MTLKIGNTEVKKIYVGNTEAIKLYIGNDLVYSSAPPPSSGGTYCAEALAYFARMDVLPTTALQDLINTTIISFKTAGLWSKIGYFTRYNIHTHQAALLNWKDDTHIATELNFPLWISKQGIQCGTSNMTSVETGFIVSVAYGTDFYTKGVICLDMSETTADGYFFGASGNGEYLLFDSGEIYFGSNVNTFPLLAAQLRICKKDNSDVIKVFDDGVLVGTETTVLDVAIDNNISFGGYNESGAPFVNGAGTVKGVMFGLDFSDADCIAFNTIVKYFDSNVGATF
jgi:hypothetical protein